MTELSLTTALSPNKFNHYPRILVITSCTGEKRCKPQHQLTLNDFKNLQNRREREQSLAEFACPAGQMYTGKQHIELMAGVHLLRESLGENAVDVKILSAGYGLISEHQPIVPYEATFKEMKVYEIDSWADYLEIHETLEKVIINYDLVFFLLGEEYLRSLSLPVKTQSNQTLIFLAAQGSKKYIRGGEAQTFILPLSLKDAKSFGYVLIGLKGFLFKKFAGEVKRNPEWINKVYTSPKSFSEAISSYFKQLELPLELPLVQINAAPIKKEKIKKSKDEIIPIPQDFSAAPNFHLGMRYFIPEWEDLVDPNYNFLTDTHTPKRNPYKDDCYAHQIYKPYNYDGVLVSRTLIEKKKNKRAEIEHVGIHDYIRFPGSIMGDCGAFGYLKQEEPPYSTEDILDYYEKAGFKQGDYGVSVDHLIVGPFAVPGIRKKRYELTLKNAEEFLRKHQSRGCEFTPVGVAQGWSPKSYADAIKELILMGYNYLALGGLAQAKTKEIQEILQAVYPHLTANTHMHLFGVARPNAIQVFRHLGVTSFDSASPLRQAWLDSGDNYHTPSGKKYAAIRVPQADGSSKRIKAIVNAGIRDRNSLKSLEQAALKALRDYDAGNLSLEETLEIVLAYDELLELPVDGKADLNAQSKRRLKHEISYRELLENEPWRDCPCPICQELKIEVIIFRGNNRNRRRGFHNTYVFYNKFKKLLKS